MIGHALSLQTHQRKASHVCSCQLLDGVASNLKGRRCLPTVDAFAASTGELASFVSLRSEGGRKEEDARSPWC